MKHFPGLRVAVASIALVLISTSTTGIAGPAKECGTHHKVISFLGAKYGESREAMGTVFGRAYMELFVSEKTGTWTVLVTNTKGLSCIATAGQNYEKAPKPIVRPKS